MLSIYVYLTTICLPVLIVLAGAYGWKRGQIHSLSRVREQAEKRLMDARMAWAHNRITEHEYYGIVGTIGGIRRDINHIQIHEID